MIKVENLTKRYGRKTALDGVSLHIKKGEIAGLLGPNGAGKSTLMNIITGYISYTDGTVEIDGTDILENPTAAKRHIGYLPEVPPLYADMTVREYLDFVYELKKAEQKPRGEHISAAAASAGVTDVITRRIGNLSKGYRQRVGIAAALIGDPDMLVLDEPTAGLDPQQITEIRALIKRLGETKTIILSSHILSEVRAVCGRVIIIHNGKIVAEDTPENLAETAAEHRRLSVEVITDKDAARIFAALPGVISANALEGAAYGAARVDITSDRRIDADLFAAVGRAAYENDMIITAMREASATLEEAFLRLTADSEVSDESDI